MNFVSEHRDHRLIAMGSALVALVLAAVLAFAARAQATETLYWNNYSDNPDTVAYANIDGSGGGLLDLTGVELDGPEGMAVDPITGRLYIAAYSNGPESEGQIVFVNLAGGGGGVFSATGAPVDEPEGLTIDPATRTIYWINTGENASIAWAKLDGSAGGTLNLTGANFNGPYRLAIDPVAGRVYWGSESEETGELVISYANVNNAGGGNLNTTGSTPTTYVDGIAVDPAGGRVYWLNEAAETLSYTRVDNGGGGDVDTTGAAWFGPYGLALDPVSGKAYWANYDGGSEEREGVFGFANFSSGGGGGGIDVATAPTAGPQDPVLLKSPGGTGVPVVSKAAAPRSALSCSTGSWAPDYPGSFVYQAPQTFAYQWTLNGQPLAGATAATFTATAPGAYACVVTGKNVTGTATQTSGPLTESAASLKLALKKKLAKVKPGKAATFVVNVLNQGDIGPTGARLCVKVPKRAKKALKAPRCKPLTLSPTGEGKAKLKVRAKKPAQGKYKVKIQVKGSAGKAVNATVRVVG